MPAKTAVDDAAAYIGRLAGDDLHPGLAFALYVSKWAIDAQQALREKREDEGLLSLNMHLPASLTWLDEQALRTQPDVGEWVIDTLNRLELYHEGLTGFGADLMGNPSYVLHRTIRGNLALEGAVGMLARVNLFPPDRATADEVYRGLVHLAEILISSRDFPHQAPGDMLCRLLVHLAQCQPGDVVFDPWATWGGTLRAAAQMQGDYEEEGGVAGVLGYSEHPTYHRIASLLAMVSRRESPQVMMTLPDIHFGGSCGDFREGVDCVVSAPALRAPYFAEGPETSERYRRGRVLGLQEMHAIDYALAMVHDKGSVVMAFSPAVLNRGTQLGESRQAWLESDLIDTVLLVPMGTPSRYSVRTAVLVLRKNKPVERRGKVFFVTVPDEAILNRRFAAWDEAAFDALLETCANYEEKDGFARFASVASILAADGDLNPPRYTYEQAVMGRPDSAVLHSELQSLDAQRRSVTVELQHLLERLSVHEGRAGASSRGDAQRRD